MGAIGSISQGDPRGFIKGRAPRKRSGWEDDFPSWFNHLEDDFSYREVQFKSFFSPVKTRFPPVEDVNETPEDGMLAHHGVLPSILSGFP